MVSELGDRLEIEKVQSTNRKWIEENVEDIIANYPSRWCLVDDYHVIIADVEFLDLYKTTIRRGDISKGALFFYATNFQPLAILTRQ